MRNSDEIRLVVIVVGEGGKSQEAKAIGNGGGGADNVWYS